MSKSIKTKLSITLLIVSLVCGIMAFALMSPTKVEARSYSASGNVIGASIRYDDNNGPEATGIRFLYVVDKATSKITSLNDIQNMGILIQRKSDLNGADLDSSNAKIDVKFYENGSASATKKINVGTLDEENRFTPDEDGGQLAMIVYLYNIPEAGFNSDFVCRGYVQLKNEALQLSDKLERSIKSVAKEVYSKGDYDVLEKEHLEYFLDKYTVTFDAGLGSIVDANTSLVDNAVTLYEGSKLDSTISATYGDYGFDGWYEDGEVVDLKIYEISKTSTLKALFTKSINDVEVAVNNDAVIPYTGVVTKVVYGGVQLNTSDYSVDGTSLIISKSVATDSATVLIYSDDYCATKCKVTVVDVTKSMRFIEIDEDFSDVRFIANLHADSITDWTNSRLSVVTNPEGGPEGTYYKMTIGTQYSTGLYLLPGLAKDFLETYYPLGDIVIDVYNSAATIEAGINLSQHLIDSVIPNTQGWHEIRIPVDKFVDEVYGKMTLDWDVEPKGTNDTHETPLIQWGYSADATRYALVGNIRVEPFDATQPWQIIDVMENMSNVKYASAVHTASRGERATQLSVATDPEGATGDFYAMNTTSDYTTGIFLKLNDNVTQDKLNLYQGGLVQFDFYQSAPATEAGGYDSLVGENVSSVVGWKTFSIPIETFMSNIYPNMTLDYATGTPFLMFGYISTTRTIYMGNFRVIPESMAWTNVTFDVGGGKQVDGTKVYNGQKLGDGEYAIFDGDTLKTDYVSELEGYVFDGWYVDGVKVDSNYAVSGANVTLKALFTKDGGDLAYAIGGDLSMDYSGEPYKVTFNGATLSATSDYSVVSDKLTVNNSALNNANGELKVYVNAYEVMIYQVGSVDTTQVRSIVNMDATGVALYNNLHVASPNNRTEFNYSGVDYGKFVTDPDSDHTGTYHRFVTDGGSNAIYIKPNITKQQLELYATGWVKFDLYLGAAHGNLYGPNGSLDFTSVDQYTGLVYAGSDIPVGWTTVQIPVSEFLSYYDQLGLNLGTDKKFDYQGYKPLISLGYSSATTDARVGYIGNIRVEPLDATKPMQIVDISTSGLRYYQNLHAASNGQNDYTTKVFGTTTYGQFVEASALEPVYANASGTYFKMHRDGFASGLYVQPNVSKAQLSQFVGGTVKFDLYWASASGNLYPNAEGSPLYGSELYSSGKVEGLVYTGNAVPTGWTTVEIPVEDFLAYFEYLGFDYLTKKPLIAWGYTSETDKTAYIGNFRVEPAGYTAG